MNRGIAYRRLGQFQRAIQDYDEAIRLDPQDALAYANRSVAKTILSLDIEAQRDVERAVALGVDRTFLEDLIELHKQDRGATAFSPEAPLDQIFEGFGGPSVDSVSEVASIKSITLDQEITDTIENAFDVDAFSFSAEAGQLYTIETGTPSANSRDTFLSLWNTDGATVLEINDDYGIDFDSRIEWTAPHGGTFYLTVEDALGESTGRYTIVVRPTGR